MIRVLCTNTEKRQYKRLQEKAESNGSGGYNRSHALITLQWIMQTISTATDEGRLGQVRAQVIYDDARCMMQAFNGIDKINKMLFPFPYAQMVKLFSLLFCFTLPFALQEEMQHYTVAACLLVVIGFYGLDEIGEL